MFSILKTAVVAGMIGFAALAAAPAEADALYVNFGHHHAGFSVRIGGGDDYRNDYWRSGRRCSPERALYKAERMGVHRARVDYVSQRKIGVTGRAHGEQVYLTFARMPGCPIIG
jgi:hypothetical protein